MSVWGKLLVGSAGLVLGGPLGAVLGLAVGHGVDKIRNADKKIYIKILNLAQMIDKWLLRQE